MKTSKPLLILLLLTACFSVSHAQKKAVKRTAARSPKVWGWQYKDKMNLRLLDIKAGVVLLSGYAHSRDKDDIIAVDAATGKLKWRIEEKDEYIWTGYIYKGAAVLDLSNRLEAFDLQTGKPKWTVEFADPIRKVDFVGDTVYATLDEDGVVAIDLATGRRKWNFRPCFNVETSVFIDEKYIILPCRTSRVFVGDSQTGKLLWQKNYYEDNIQGVFLNGDKILVVAQFYRGFGGKIDGYNAATGAANWSQKLELGNDVTDAKLYQNKLYVSFRHGFFWVFDAVGGKLIKKFGGEKSWAESSGRGMTEDVGNEVIRKISFQKDMVGGITEQNGILYVLNTKTDNIVNRFETGLGYAQVYIFSPPFIYFEDGQTLSVFNQNSGRSEKITDAYVSGARTDEAGNIYLVANNSELYFFRRNRIEQAISSHRQLGIKSTGAPGGMGSGMAGSGGVSEVYSELVFSDKKTYLTYTNFGKQQGSLYEIDTASGAARNVFQFKAAYVTDPVVADGVAYFGTAHGALTSYGRPSFSTYKDNPAEFYAVDTRTGKTLWQFKTNAGLMLKPIITGDAIVFHGTDGNLYSLKRGDGSLIWKGFSGIPNSMENKYEDTDLYGTGDEIVMLTQKKQAVAIDKNDPAKYRQFGEANQEFLTVMGDKVITMDGDSFLFAFDLKSGNRLWRSFIGKKISGSYGKSGNILYVRAKYDEALAIDTTTGDIVWERKLESGNRVALLAGEMVYDAGVKNIIYSGESGVRKKIFETPSDYTLEREADWPILFFRSGNSILAYDRITDRTIWSIRLP